MDLRTYLRIKQANEAINSGSVTGPNAANFDKVTPTKPNSALAARLQHGLHSKRLWDRFLSSPDGGEVLGATSLDDRVLSAVPPGKLLGIGPDGKTVAIDGPPIR